MPQRRGNQNIEFLSGKVIHFMIHAKDKLSIKNRYFSLFREIKKGGNMKA